MPESATALNLLDLLVVRHAAAEERDATRFPDDSLRPLTRPGATRFERMLRVIAPRIGSIDLLLASRAERAWATAKLVSRRCEAPKPLRCPALELPSLEAQGLAGVLDALRDQLDALNSAKAKAGTDKPGATRRCVALVGHEPWLSAFASVFLDARSRSSDVARPSSIRMRKGAIAALRLDGDVAPGMARLEWLVHPRMF